MRENRARIIGERCIDCGECIRVCPYHAKIAITDSLTSIMRWKHRIALPAPALYGQFKNLKTIDHALSGLLSLGFTDVFEVARGAEYISLAIKERLKTRRSGAPLISSACPAIVRLVQVRFPGLIDNIVDMESPMEAAALIAKTEYARRMGVPVEEIGAFFITPCAAKMTAVHNPIAGGVSHVDGAISILDIYGALSAQLREEFEPRPLRRAQYFGVGWASSGGEATAVGADASLAVDGIQNVIHALEEIENNKLTDLVFFEGLACTGGCVGGPLVFENGFVAKNRLRKLIEALPRTPLNETIADLAAYDLQMSGCIEPNTAMQLDESLAEALRKLEQLDAIQKDLPGLDCGSCGSPTCRALAEDIVRGDASEINCIFRLKEEVRRMAQAMVDLGNMTRR